MAKLDGAAEVAMALHGINDPFVGQSQGMGRQQEIADFARKNRIIAGPGIRITQTEQGQIIEASDITITNINIQPLMTLATVGTIVGTTPNGAGYSINIKVESEDGSKEITTDDFVFVCNNMIEFSAYNEGDPILVYKTLVRPLDSGSTEVLSGGE
ncbi:MAG: hypothetical protein II332_00575 [Kiritimatiellae bacterium]|nr:hypothetical protein [Kiritimatiellia bacterium]